MIPLVVGYLMKYARWRILLVLAFLIIALSLPIITFDFGAWSSYPPDTPPPGWSRYWTYFLAADYDYFWRFRISPLTAHLWLLVCIMSLVMLTPPLSTRKIDMIASISIGAYAIIAWVLFVQYNFIQLRPEIAQPYQAVYATPLIPVVGLIFILASRFIDYIYDRQRGE